ncbi:MAG: hypothetical protein SH868_00870 [Bythopirellula sp.]|nr:hypothetical protein [Bythopirellula sp.]
MLMVVGCDSGPETGPAVGIVYYNDAPLPYGSVMFQPERGQPATGQIGADGKFEMATFQPGDGATVGPNKVRINCYSSQSPGEKSKPVVGERSIGALLIPQQYTSFDASGLTADVKSDGNEPFEFRLTGPPVKFPK